MEEEGNDENNQGGGGRCVEEIYIIESKEVSYMVRKYENSTKLFNNLNI